jgi:hypothetical protein
VRLKNQVLNARQPKGIYPRLWATRKTMTLVIGVLAEVRPSNNPSIPDSGTLLLAADTMATYQAAVPFVYR